MAIYVVSQGLDNGLATITDHLQTFKGNIQYWADAKLPDVLTQLRIVLGTNAIIGLMVLIHQLYGFPVTTHTFITRLPSPSC